MTYIGKGPEVVAAVAALASMDPVGWLGLGLLSSLVVVFFLGILTLQGTAYFKAFPNDNPWLWRLVCANIVLSIAQTYTVIAPCWDWFVTHYGDWNVVVSFPWTYTAAVIIAQLTVALTQSFFAYRCFILTQRNRIILTLLTGGTSVGFLLFIGVGVALAVDPYNAALSHKFAVPALCITICTDVFITGLITWKVSASKRGFNESTDNGLAKIVRITWEAAAPPAVAAIFNLVVLLTMNNKNLLYGFLNVLIPRLYVFSLMYTLNSRPEVRNVFEGTDRTGWTTRRSPSRPLSLPASSRKRTPQGSTNTRIVFAHIDSDGERTTVCTSDTIGVINERVGGGGGHCHDFLGGSAADLHLQIDLDRWEEEEDIKDHFTMRTIREGGRSKSPSSATGTGLV